MPLVGKLACLNSEALAPKSHWQTTGVPNSCFEKAIEYLMTYVGVFEWNMTDRNMRCCITLVALKNLSVL